MHHHSGRLVDHQKQIILVHNIKRDILRSRRGLHFLRHIHRNPVTSFHTKCRAAGLIVHSDSTGLDQALHLSTTQI